MRRFSRHLAGEGALDDAMPPWVHTKWRGGEMSTSDSRRWILEMKNGLSRKNDFENGLSVRNRFFFTPSYSEHAPRDKSRANLFFSH